MKPVIVKEERISRVYTPLKVTKLSQHNILPTSLSSTLQLKTPNTTRSTTTPAVKSALKNTFKTHSQTRLCPGQSVKIDRDPPHIRVFRRDDSFTSTEIKEKENESR